jgi:hypothetical protein
MYSMADTCHVGKCENTSYDDCAVCHQPTCRKHGNSVGEQFVCVECADQAE